MRVVAGSLRGRAIVAPEGHATRPTTDRVREALFNALASAGGIEGSRVLDLFAGSGALGIEALSRGASHCTFVERDRMAVDAIRRNVANLGLSDRTSIVVGDVLSRLPALPPADLVLADPPYGFADWSVLLGGLGSLMSTTGLVVLESGEPLGEVSGWETVREKRYGRTWVTFLRRTVE
ncbi:MAG: 16S rRNA (guanine(966)-N(2))-methyltransferase RsmD [Actinomycetota bacterium]